MFMCEKCGAEMEVAVTSKKRIPGKCRRERECTNPNCGYRCESTEVSTAAYQRAVHRAAIELAKTMVTDLREILFGASPQVGKNGTSENLDDLPSSAMKR